LFTVNVSDWYAHNLEGDPNTLAISMAEIFAGLGDRANALRWLEECYRHREPFITYIGVDPMLAPYRDDPALSGRARSDQLSEAADRPTQVGRTRLPEPPAVNARLDAIVPA
jgi:hypothetical protein